MHVLESNDNHLQHNAERSQEWRNTGVRVERDIGGGVVQASAAGTVTNPAHSQLCDEMKRLHAAMTDPWVLTADQIVEIVRVWYIDSSMSQPYAPKNFLYFWSISTVLLARY